MRVLVCGDRDWHNFELMERTLDSWFSADRDRLIHGDCRGADRMAGSMIPEECIEKYPPDWEKHGKAAGPIRNQQMLDTGIDLVIAFHTDIARSKGTKDMITRANQAGVPVILISTEHLSVS